MVSDRDLQCRQIKFNGNGHISPDARIDIAVRLGKAHFHAVFTAIRFIQANLKVGEVSQGALPILPRM